MYWWLSKSMPYPVAQHCNLSGCHCLDATVTKDINQDPIRRQKLFSNLNKHDFFFYKESWTIIGSWSNVGLTSKK